MLESLTPERIEQTSAWLGVFRDSRLPGMVNVSSQSLAEAADVVDALATAVARARREGLEEAAKVLDARADYFDRAYGYRSWDDAVRSYRASAKEVRALAATPPEARQTETGDRDRIIERLNRLAKDAWVGSVEEWAAQAVMAMCAASRLLAASPPPAIGNLEGEGRSHG